MKTNQIQSINKSLESIAIDRHVKEKIEENTDKKRQAFLEKIKRAPDATWKKHAKVASKKDITKIHIYICSIRRSKKPFVKLNRLQEYIFTLYLPFEEATRIFSEISQIEKEVDEKQKTRFYVLSNKFEQGQSFDSDELMEFIELCRRYGTEEQKLAVDISDYIKMLKGQKNPLQIIRMLQNYSKSGPLPALNRKVVNSGIKQLEAENLDIYNELVGKVRTLQEMDANEILVYVQNCEKYGDALRGIRFLKEYVGQQVEIKPEVKVAVEKGIERLIEYEKKEPSR